MININLSNNSSHLFDPNAYVVPYNEFRAVLIVYSTHTNEEPYVFEFLVDLTSLKLSENKPTASAEVYYLEGSNNLILGV